METAKQTVKTEVRGDEVVRTVEIARPRVVTWEQLLKGCKVEEDRYADPPWDMGTVEDQTPKWWRERGLSKQRAAECAAAQNRRTAEQVARWRRDGWEVVTVSCSLYEYSNGVGGVYDPDSAYLQELQEDMAREVAHQMVQDGYVIEGMPPVADPAAQRLANQRETYHRNLWLGC